MFVATPTSAPSLSATKGLSLFGVLFLAFAQHAAAAVPASDCPPGAVAANLCAVWDLQTTAGVTEAALYKPSAHPGRLPEGTSVGTSPGQVMFPTSGSNLATRFDFTGYEVGTRSGGAVTVTESKFAYPGAGKLLQTDSNVTLTRSSFDGSRLLNSGASALVTAGTGTTFTMHRVRIQHSPMLSFYSFAAVANVTWSYFADVGENPNRENPHLELGRSDKGVFTATDSFFDMRTYNPVPVTGVLYFEANRSSGSPITVHLNRVILDWGRGYNLIAPIQAAGKDQNVTITISNSAIKPGTGGYVLKSESGTGVVRVIDGGGNRNLYTGAPVDITARK